MRLIVLGFKDWHWVGTVEREEEVPPSNGSSGSPAAIPVDWQRPVEFMYQELVQLVGGDQVAADRLIEAERRQYPKETLRQLIERAVQRYLRERR